MKIVIELSDDVYEDIKDYTNCEWRSIIALHDAINKTIILPKGHGRLGDLSRLVEALNEAQVEGTDEYKGLGVAKQIVENTATLVVADKALNW